MGESMKVTYRPIENCQYHFEVYLRYILQEYYGRIRNLNHNIGTYRGPAVAVAKASLWIAWL